MKRQATLIAYAVQHGCTLEIDGSGANWEITLEAPEGMLFKSSGCSIDSGITGHGWINTPGNKVDWDKAYDDLVEIISYGFMEDPDA